MKKTLRLALDDDEEAARMGSSAPSRCGYLNRKDMPHCPSSPSDGAVKVPTVFLSFQYSRRAGYTLSSGSLGELGDDGMMNGLGRHVHHARLKKKKKKRETFPQHTRSVTPAQYS